MKKLLLLFVIILMGSACNKVSDEEMEKATVNKIDCYTMKEKMVEGAVLIDVRTKAEYDAGTLEFAINVPVETIESNILDKVSSKDTPIIVFCRSGNRSSEAANKLIELGYTKVYDLGAMNSCN